MAKWLCSECSEVGTDESVLKAPNPFDPDDEICGCPSCKAVNSLTRACDEPGCAREGTCGGPTPDGYKWHCYEHSWLAKEATGQRQGTGHE